ncbi:hypothetical protein HWV62_26636 [Athelia sp. TMB]|nr:hypothetical protein HWV62_26636 [Athelia sp. TMB]
MPWETVKLNDGSKVPSIAYGTWKRGNGQESIDLVDQAFAAGFDHIDTAQAYRNETEAGIAIRESGLKREEIFVTTKYSGVDGLDVQTSIQNSLKNLGLTYVDLYLIHSPRLAKPDIPTSWKEFEKVKEQGYAKSIGVSNFNVEELTILINSAKVVPAVNQIMVQPYVWKKTAPIVAFGNQHGILTEAYSPLYSLQHPGGAVDAPVNAIATRLGVTAEEVLLAWAHEKVAGGIVITSTTKKERLERYLSAGDLLLTGVDIDAIDAAGLLGGKSLTMKKVARRAATMVGLGIGLYTVMVLGGVSFHC